MVRFICEYCDYEEDHDEAEGEIIECEECGGDMFFVEDD